MAAGFPGNPSCPIGATRPPARKGRLACTLITLDNCRQHAQMAPLGRALINPGVRANLYYHTL
eukprot:8507273-Pyramimonas_sp.AAC.1